MNLPDDLQRASTRRVRSSVSLSVVAARRLLRGVSGITLGRRIYLAAGVDVVRSLRHELVHVRQIARVGVIPFYWQWLGSTSGTGGAG